MYAEADIQEKELISGLLQQLNTLSELNEAIDKKDVEKIDDLMAKKQELLNLVNLIVFSKLK